MILERTSKLKPCCALWTGTACILGFGFIEMVILPVNFLQFQTMISVDHENHPRGYSRMSLEGDERM